MKAPSSAAAPPTSQAASISSRVLVQDATIAGVTKIPEPTIPPITTMVASNSPMRRARPSPITFPLVSRRGDSPPAPPAFAAAVAAGEHEEGLPIRSGDRLRVGDDPPGRGRGLRLDPRPDPRPPGAQHLESGTLGRIRQSRPERDLALRFALRRQRGEHRLPVPLRRRVGDAAGAAGALQARDVVRGP